MEKENGAVPRVLLVTFMMVNIRMTVSMALDASSGPVETNTKASISKMIDMAMAKCVGLMALGIKENGTEVFNTDTVK